MIKKVLIKLTSKCSLRGKVNKGMIVLRKGDLIKYYRKQAEITQEELASGVCSIPYLSLVIPSEEILNLLYERLGKSPNDP